LYLPLPEFIRRTGVRKKKRNCCPACGKGVLFSTTQPRIRDALNQQTYECNQCSVLVITEWKEGT
jgi:DNA-directed RNA polymerase subunit M/transcription elongation factor TFIIS